MKKELAGLDCWESYRIRVAEATLTQPSTHTVPGTVLTAHDKDSCILSCGNSSDTNKNRGFPEEQSSLQEELMKKFLSNSFLLSACFVPESVLHLIMCYLICCPQPMKEIVIIPVYR